VCGKRTYTLQTVVSPTLIPRWPTVGRVAYTVVRLVALDCTGGLSTRYPTADSVVDVLSVCQSGMMLVNCDD